MILPLATATSADERDRASRVAVLPVGSFEQHGAHLPLSTDTLVACAIADAIARAYNLFLLPPITIACSQEHAAWPGTVSIRAQTLIAVVTDIAESLRSSGVEHVVVVNGHGGNYALANVVQEANVAGPRMALFPRREDWAAARAAAGLESTAHEDMHAGEIETSVLMHLWPQLVGADYAAADHVAERPHLLVLGLQASTVSGVVGRPSLGTPEKGQAVLRALASGFTETLRVLTGAGTARSVGEPDD
ncbi:creatininase family protein [Streptomyces sp. BE20]|uniref:creatininase family protein n=1 Tax=Streptomyces sp. BE20 TaxID=3002525 RepID=UPI002E75C64B|nr:creatininase family protein [Streptomyces sp. BE20]MEE1820971.1 creatininase family protein [Streptomyces sp. BE20]